MKRIYLAVIMSVVFVSLNSNMTFAQSSLEESLLLNQSTEGQITYAVAKIITQLAEKSQQRKQALAQLPECSDAILECSEIDGTDRNISEDSNIPLPPKETPSPSECIQE